VDAARGAKNPRCPLPFPKPARPTLEPIPNRLHSWPQYGLKGSLMRWTRSSWLALAGAAAVVFVAWVLFAPEILAVHR